MQENNKWQDFDGAIKVRNCVSSHLQYLFGFHVGTGFNVDNKNCILKTLMSIFLCKNRLFVVYLYHLIIISQYISIQRYY